MTVELEQLAEYVGASPAEPLLPLVLEVSQKQVSEFLGPRGVSRCPVSIQDLATLQLGSEHWVRRNSPGGVASWASGEVPVRLAKDAMLSVAPMLARYKGLGAVG